MIKFLLGRPKNERHDMQINQRDRLASLSFELLFKSSIKEIASLFHIFGSIHIYGSCLIHKFAINHMFRIPILQVFQPTNADFKKTFCDHFSAFLFLTNTMIKYGCVRMLPR